jgi:acetoin utilization deacetylase AcuC-like enzyme
MTKDHHPGGLPIIWHEAYEADIGPHVFPTMKYRAARDRLIGDGTIAAADISHPGPATNDQIALVHTPHYMRKMESGTFTWQDEMQLELPFSTELRDAMWLCVGGSIEAARQATRRGVAVHLGGGFHHAFPDHGEGFCLVNDVAIAIRALMKDSVIERAVVIDCDLHHGNGTAAIFADQSEVFTFSIHEENNYPLFKPPSDLDIGLPQGTGDDDYLDLLAEHIPSILVQHCPQFAFYLAGADPYRDDQLGNLSLTMDGLRRRDELVFAALADAGVPAAAALAGGYARRFEDTVEIHCEMVRAARRQLEALDRGT